MSSIKQDGSSSPKYWRSLDQLADSTEFRSFVENEFPASADQMMTPASRRNFLKLMGASMALAGMTACRWPREEILPFSERPEGYVPGTPRHFATAMEFAGVAGGVVVTSYDGRPVKIEGNELHPDSLGSSDARTQASLLELYDPERSGELLSKSDGGQSATDWSAFDSFADGHFDGLRKNRGSGLRVLAGADSSPTVSRMRERFAETFPEAGWVEYESISRDNIRTGTRMLWGRALRPHWDLKRAQLVVSFDDDFLAQHPNAVRYSRDLIEGRNPDGHDFGRLIVVEGSYSMTGCVADRRVVVDTQAIPAYVGCVAAHLFLEEGLESPFASTALRSMLEGFRSHELYGTIDKAMLHDLLAHRGGSVLTVGPGQPAEVHALVGVLNLALGNIGKTITFTAESDAGRQHHHAALGELIGEMQAGTVETLVIFEGNPLFDAPADLDVAGALQNVGTVIRAGRFVDETSAAADWHLPLTHYLETWGDGLGYRGTYSVAQPLIEPLRNGRPKIELLAAMLGHSVTAHDAVQATLAERYGDDRWRGALHDGLVQDSEASVLSPDAANDRWCGALAAHSGSAGDGYHLVFLTDPRVHDGRFANNGWLQELPDSVTKLTWITRLSSDRLRPKHWVSNTARCCGSSTPDTAWNCQSTFSPGRPPARSAWRSVMAEAMAVR